MKKVCLTIVALFIFILSIGAKTGERRASVKEAPIFDIELVSGYGHIPNAYSSAKKESDNRDYRILSNCVHYGIDFSFRLTPMTRVGLLFSENRSMPFEPYESAIGENSESLTIQYIGPVVKYYESTRNGKFCFTASASIGRFLYVNKMWLSSSIKEKIIYPSVGRAFGAELDYYITNHLSIGVRGSILAGFIRKYTVVDVMAETSRSDVLDEEDWRSIGAINFGLALRFNL